MNYKKEFELSMNNGLILKTGKSESLDFIDKKILKFKNKKNFDSKDVHIELIKDILDMCEYDEKNAEIDFSQMDLVRGFKKCNHNRNIIKIYNIIEILGAIYFEVYDLHKSIINCSSCISYNSEDMFIEGCNLLTNTKKKNDLDGTKMPTYGGTLIFMTLFESQIKILIKNIFVIECLRKLQKDITENKYKLEPMEQNLHSFLLSDFLGEKESEEIYDAKTAITVDLYKLLIKYNIIAQPSKRKNAKDITEEELIEKLIKEKITLTQLIKSELFKNKIDPTFLKLFETLFITLDLRNNIVHSNFAYIPYYRITIAPLMFMLCKLVCDKACLK